MSNNSVSTLDFGEVDGYPKYRWVILALAFIVPLMILTSWYFLPVYQVFLEESLGITPGQYSYAFTLPSLVGVFLALPAGILADRFGYKKLTTLGVSIFAVGLLVRVIANSYSVLLAAMVMHGLGMALVVPILPKIIRVWFPPEQMGLATGLYYNGLVLGVSLGYIFGPFFAGWGQANLVFGGIAVALALIYAVLAKPAPPGKEIPSAPIIEGAKAALRSRNAWLAGISAALAMGGLISILATFPAALNDVYGISMAVGSLVTSIILWARIAGGITLPAISDYIGNLKIFLIILGPIFGAAIYFGWMNAESTILMYILLAIGGYAAGGLIPMFNTIPPLLPNVEGSPVKGEYVGGASGVVASIRQLGAWAGLPIIVMPVIQSQGYDVGYLLASAMFSAPVIFMLFFKEPTR